MDARLPVRGVEREREGGGGGGVSAPRLMGACLCREEGLGWGLEARSCRLDVREGGREKEAPPIGAIGRGVAD
jgi:hypothetical protein